MSAVDRFEEKGEQGGRSAQDPPRRGRMVAPDDSLDLPFVTTSYRVIVSENLKVMYANDEIETLPAAVLLVGYQYSGQLKRIFATGSGGGHTAVLCEGPD